MSNSAGDELVWMLVDIVARGGNLLLNVGPTADGQIPLAPAVRLAGLGWWLRVNGEAVYGTHPWGPQVAQTDGGRDVRYTTNGATVFALMRGAPAGEVRLPYVEPAAGAQVRMLGNSRSLPSTVRGGDLVVRLPDHLPSAPVTVLAVDGY